jgi:hypothetical protein
LKRAANRAEAFSENDQIDAAGFDGGQVPEDALVDFSLTANSDDA